MKRFYEQAQHKNTSARPPSGRCGSASRGGQPAPSRRRWSPSPRWRLRAGRSLRGHHPRGVQPPPLRRVSPRGCCRSPPTSLFVTMMTGRARRAGRCRARRCARSTSGVKAFRRRVGARATPPTKHERAGEVFLTSPKKKHARRMRRRRLGGEGRWYFFRRGSARARTRTWARGRV